MTENEKIIVHMLEKMNDINAIKPGEVPDIALYMDQVLTFMDNHIGDKDQIPEDHILTKTMINNYTKNDLLPPPVKKKYSKEHMYVLTFIYYLKNLLSINEIQTLLNPMTDHFFADADKELDIEDIYREIYELEKVQRDSEADQVKAMRKLSDTSFKDVDDEEKRKFLQFLSLISLMSFDVYLKKKMIQDMIADFSESGSALLRPSGDKKDKKEKKEKKNNSKDA